MSIAMGSMRIGCLFATLSAAAYAINAFLQTGKLSLPVQTALNTSFDWI